MDKVVIHTQRRITAEEAVQVSKAADQFARGEVRAMVLGDGMDCRVINDSHPMVYLCGTITPDPVHLEWRRVAEEELVGYGIGVLNPVRGKDPSDWTSDGMDSAKLTPYDNGGFVPRDRRDLRRADAVLLVFLAAGRPERQSIGTWCELGWATAWDIPIVVVTDLPEVEKHPFVWRQAAKVCKTLDEGLEYLEFLLT